MFVESQNSPASLLERESNAWGLKVENGVYWFVAPNGEKFYGSGVNGVDAGSAPEEVEGRPAYYLWKLYPSIDDLVANVHRRLGQLGLYSLRAWDFFVEKIGLPFLGNPEFGRLDQGALVRCV